MNEQGHYDVTVHLRSAFDEPLHRTYPFGQWAEIGFWLDEIGATEGDTVAVTFHPLPPLRGGSITCPACGAVFAWEGEEPKDCIRCGRDLVESRALAAPLGELPGDLGHACVVDESAGQRENVHTPEELAWQHERLAARREEEQHSVRAELHEGAGLLDLHPVQGVDLDAVERLEEFARGLGEIDGSDPSTGTED